MLRKIMTFFTLAALSFAFSGSAMAADPIKLKVATFEPGGAFIASKIVKAWADKVTAESNGGLEVKVYAGGVLGGPPKQYDIVKGGIADISWTVLGYIGNQFPLAQVVELPFLTRTSKAGTKALNTLYEEGYLDKEMEGIKLVGLHSNPAYQLHMRDKNVLEASDLKGMKMRVPSKIAGSILAKLGATGVSVPAPGTYEALQKGVVDGTPFPYTAVGSFKLYEVTKYHTEVNITNATFGLIMNEDKYNSLPDNLKKVIDNNSGHAYGDWAAELIDAQNTKLKAEIASLDGHVMSKVSEGSLQRFKSILAPDESDWLAEMESKGLDGNAVLKRAREIINSIDG